MGRHKIKKSEKKKEMSIAISIDNFRKFNEFKIKNKSKVVNRLLKKFLKIKYNEK